MYFGSISKEEWYWFSYTVQCEDKTGHSTYTNNIKEIDVTQVTCNTTALRKKKMWFVTPVLSSKSTGMHYNIACGISKKIKIKIT